MALEGDNSPENRDNGVTIPISDEGTVESIQKSRASLSLLKKSHLPRLVSRNESTKSREEAMDANHSDADNRRISGLHGRNTPVMSPMPSIAESLSSLGSGGSFPDRSKMKSKLQRMVERARDEDRRHQQAIREHKLHDEKPLFQKMAEKAAIEANKEEKTKIDEYHRAMAQKRVNRVPTHSPMPVQSPVYNTPHSQVADVERKRTSSRNKYARKTPARAQVDYERGIDRDRDTSHLKRRHQNPQFSDTPADSMDRRGRGGAGAAGGKSRRAAEKKKKLPLFMRMQEKAREEEERLERDKLERYQQLRIQKKINSVPSRQELRERAARYEQHVLQMQQQHYEEHMDAYSIASKDHGHGHDHDHGHDHGHGYERDSRGRKQRDDRVRGRRSNDSLDDRPVVYNANPPDFASPLPGELDDNDNDNDGSMFSPLSMASATPSSGIKAMQSRLSNKLARAAGKEKLKKKSRSGDDSLSAADDNGNADEDDDLNSRGSKVRFHVGGRGRRGSPLSGINAQETDQDTVSIGGSSQTSKNNRTRDKGRGSATQNQGPLWLAEVLETDSSEQGLVMMYAEGFSMYMVEQGMIPE